MGVALLEVDDLRVSFASGRSRVAVLRGLGFSVAKGEILSVVGESGSGKSVSMKAVMGLLPRGGLVDSGSAIWRGRHANGSGIQLLDLPEPRMRALRGSGISMVFQDPMTALDPLKTVGDHLAEVVARHRGLGRAEAFNEGVRYLDLVGIPSAQARARQYPHEFSGGMRQRAMIAMALSCESELMIADEPTTALDVTIQAQILDILADLRRGGGLSVILITHDLGIVASLCDRVLVMYAGLAMESGKVGDIFASPAHPYTRALLSSVPKLDDGERGRLYSIKGIAPSFKEHTAGCPFAPRCEQSAERCRAELPELRDIGGGRLSRCHFSRVDGGLRS
jgi:peptide/nickel transport system ATP-binding protein